MTFSNKVDKMFKMPVWSVRVTEYDLKQQGYRSATLTVCPHIPGL